MLHTDARISTTHETEEPVPLQGTLDRFLLRPEQTGWAKLYVLLKSSKGLLVHRLADFFDGHLRSPANRASSSREQRFDERVGAEDHTGITKLSRFPKTSHD